MVEVIEQIGGKVCGLAFVCNRIVYMLYFYCRFFIRGYVERH